MTAGTISFGLTLLIFSYLLGDNFLYRLTVSIFVGLASAFTVIAVVESAIIPLLDGSFANSFLFVIAGMLALFLLFKPLSSLKSLTNLALAYLVAVGTAVALVGALTGTVIPLIRDTTELAPMSDFPAFLNSVIVLVGMVTSLLYFRYQANLKPDGTIQRGRVMKVVTSLGQGFIVITLGALYGTAILTSLTILSGHISLIVYK